LTNSFGSVNGANATAVAASGSLISATAAHLARFPWRDCHILTYIRQHSSGQGPIYLPVVIQGPSEDHSTVLSRDAVAKACPSGDHAQSQIIRECALSMVMGTYPSGGYAKLVGNYFPRHRFKKKEEKKKKQAEGNVSPDSSLLWNRRQVLSRETVKTS
jgi:hypothetical protein